jgi:hypothetical protein
MDTCHSVPATLPTMPSFQRAAEDYDSFPTILIVDDHQPRKADSGTE